jgi:hypothetical protein
MPEAESSGLRIAREDDDSSITIRFPFSSVPLTVGVITVHHLEAFKWFPLIRFSSIIFVLYCIYCTLFTMPICTIHLLSLNVTLSEFLAALRTSAVTPLTIGRVVRWIITPSKISVDPLLRKHAKWDVLLIIPNADSLPQSLRAMVRQVWSVKAGVPSRLLRGFAAKNERLLSPRPGDIPPLTGSLDSPRKADSAQALELSDELHDWIRTFGTREGQGAVSMLNLLAFRDGMKEDYLKYGKAFGESVGIRRGGTAKIVGTVIDVSSSPPGVKEWDELRLRTIHPFTILQICWRAKIIKR